MFIFWYQLQKHMHILFIILCWLVASLAETIAVQSYESIKNIDWSDFAYMFVLCCFCVPFIPVFVAKNTINWDKLSPYCLFTLMITLYTLIIILLWWILEMEIMGLQPSSQVTFTIWIDKRDTMMDLIFKINPLNWGFIKN